VDILCASGSFPSSAVLSMSLSNFMPNPNGPGGTLEISLNGQVVATWNATNKEGSWVPNGNYYFVLETTDANGNKVTLTRVAFVMPYHDQMVSMKAMPNVASSGGTIHFVIAFSGVPADGQSSLKIYSVSGELIQTLVISGGTATWNLTNRGGQLAASGVYLAVLDGTDPMSGVKMKKVVKVMVVH